MNRHFLLLIAAFLLLTCRDVTFAQFLDQPQNLSVAFSQPTELEVPLIGGLFLVPVTVNGSPKPLYFLLDTGAEVSVIQKNAAKILGIKGNDQLSLGGAGGDTESDASVVDNVRLDFNGETVQNAQLGVVHLKLQDQFHHPCDGILGFDILKHSIVKLDYQNRTVEFLNPATFTDTPPIRIPFQVVNNAPILQISLASEGGIFTTPILLDTGSFGGIQLSPAFVDENPNFRMNITQKSKVEGLGGRAGYGRGTSPEIKLGDYVMHDQPVELLSQCPGNGLLGAQILSQFKVTIDATDKALLLQPTGDITPTNPGVIAAPVIPLTPPDTQKKSESAGLEVNVTDTGYQVISVEPGSQAQRAGLHKGDTIVQLNHVDLGVMEIDQFKKLLCSPIKWFGIYRDGEFRELRVKDER